MRGRDLARFIGSIAALLALIAAPVSAPAEDFYKGKTLRVMVGFPPGGGFDANGRLLARYIGRHIPGTPEVIVMNTPGAASATSIAHLDVNLPTDGTVIDEFNFGLLGDSLLQPAKTAFDFRHYAWIGSIAEDVTTCFVWRDDAPRTIAEMRGHHYLFGDAGAGSSEDLNTKILQRVFKLDITEARGYAGSAEVRIAIERREVEGACGSWSSLPADWLTSPKFHPLLRTAKSVPEGMSADVPYILDLAPDDNARQVVRFLLAGGELGRPFIASSAVPTDRIDILRAAFAATVEDPDFIAEAKKLRLPISPRTGAEAVRSVEQLYATPPAIIEAARKVIAEN
jgi:tripartite-type tricarboxylate transporter receptor subunit TctC